VHPGRIVDVPGPGEHPAGTGPDLPVLAGHVVLLLVEMPSPVGLPVDCNHVRADSPIEVSGDHTDPVRNAYAASVDSLLTTAARIGADRWSRPATGEWTVLDLFAHTVRGMAVIAAFLDADLPRPEVVLPDAAAYFRAALGVEGAHAGIAARAVDTAGTLGPDPLAWAGEVAAASLERVAATPDDRVVVHVVGALRFADYLGTRVTELVLHTLNLQLACGMDLSVPTDAVALVDRILLDLADRADPVGLALALSGRSGPRGANVLG